MDQTSLSSRRDFVARLLLKAYSETRELDGAIKQLEALDNPMVAAELAALSTAQQSTQSWTTALQTWAPDHPLTQLVAANGVDIERLEPVRKALAARQQMLTNIFTRVLLTMTYLLILLALATGTTFIINGSVTASFVEVFSTFGAELPATTRFMVENSHVIFILLTLLLLYFAAVTASLKLGKKNTRKIPLLIRLTPGISGIFRRSQNLEQSILRLAIPEQLEQHHPEWAQRIALAQQLAMSDEEIDQFLNQLLDDFERKANNGVRGLTLTVQILVVGVIFNLLVSFYLPIFQLGAVT
ncbi:MAG: hypothetical protein HWE13_10370 [Gammaproteobacteria bacterium]|nr:hypothetical protein [Gammaproteobacteria bacterium]NVK88524.1 hypothetical protein [Gammaproteobacteria bacterium]